MKASQKRKVFFSQKSKKGNAVLDTATILVVLVAMAIISIIGASVFDSLNTEIQVNPEMTNTSKSASGELYNKYPTLMDNLIMMAFILLIIAVVISVFFIDTHPIFFIISFITLIGIFVVAMLLGNVYEDIMTDGDFSTYANYFTYTTWIMTHILQVIIAAGMLILIALYVKFK